MLSFAPSTFFSNIARNSTKKCEVTNEHVSMGKFVAVYIGPPHTIRIPTRYVQGNTLTIPSQYLRDTDTIIKRYLCGTQSRDTRRLIIGNLHDTYRVISSRWPSDTQYVSMNCYDTLIITTWYSDDRHLRRTRAQRCVFALGVLYLNKFAANLRHHRPHRHRHPQLQMSVVVRCIQQAFRRHQERNCELARGPCQAKLHLSKKNRTTYLILQVCVHQSHSPLLHTIW